METEKELTLEEMMAHGRQWRVNHLARVEAKKQTEAKCKASLAPLVAAREELQKNMAASVAPAPKKEPTETERLIAALTDFIELKARRVTYRELSDRDL